MVGVDGRFFTQIGHRSILRAQHGNCFYCERDMGAETTRDHLRPRHKGYSLALNIVMCCEKCNLAKGGRDPTADELAKARKLYTRLGLPAFAF